MIGSAGSPVRAAEVHTVTLTLTDDDGDLDQSVFEFVVVYDPDGGYVTGGGWIHSPVGAYAPDPSMTGMANFGFVSKYQRGASTPTGNTTFRFKAASLDFRSSSYEWLVISGPRAQYKGIGTISGEGDYGFIFSAIDGQTNGGGGEDRFRIKIWDRASDEIAYDNQMGAEDGADPATTLGEGSIVIHK